MRRYEGTRVLKCDKLNMVSIQYHRHISVSGGGSSDGKVVGEGWRK